MRGFKDKTENLEASPRIKRHFGPTNEAFFKALSSVNKCARPIVLTLDLVGGVAKQLQVASIVANLSSSDARPYFLFFRDNALFSYWILLLISVMGLLLFAAKCFLCYHKYKKQTSPLNYSIYILLSIIENFILIPSHFCLASTFLSLETVQILQNLPSVLISTSLTLMRILFIFENSYTKKNWFRRSHSVANMQILYFEIIGVYLSVLIANTYILILALTLVSVCALSEVFFYLPYHFRYTNLLEASGWLTLLVLSAALFFDCLLYTSPSPRDS